MKHNANRFVKHGLNRTLAFQSLEARNLLTLGLADSLADVAASSTGISITQTGPADPAGKTLVVQGTNGDVILVQADPSVAGAVDVIFDGQQTVVPGPIAAIVAYGSGQVSITVT